MSTTEANASECLELDDPETRIPAANEAEPVCIPGLVVGTLIGFKEDGQVPLVIFPRQVGSAAVAATSIADVHGSHLGRQVALMFESGNPHRPVIIGLTRDNRPWPLTEQPGDVTVEADGTRLVVSARNQLVLRCGKASITLTKAGKVLIQGAYVSSRSSGVNSMTGGSIHLN